jgi:hypothetical protein
MLKTEAIKKFLRHTTCPIAQKYSPEMEVQVNVLKGGGRKVQGEYKGKNWRGWTDGEETWKSFRIPWISTQYQDTSIRWNLAKHVEGIGMSGWNWKKKESLWVGYDFDSLSHKEGLSEEELSELVKKTKNVPWVNLLNSTSGKGGMHLYLFFDKAVETQNHNEHAALARSLLSLLTIETGYNFNTNVDCVGMILWVYHVKSEGTKGLTWIKEGSKFPTERIPVNWKDHIPVCNLSRGRVKSKDRGVDKLNSALKRFLLSEKHLKILSFLKEKAKKQWWWDTDYNMLVCHTLDLVEVHKGLNLKGVFKTNSSGSSEQNCFAFPSRAGSFIVRRYGKRVSEAKTWTVDSDGWTRCVFNSDPSVHDACYIAGALENEKGEFVFKDAIQAEKGLRSLKIDFNYPQIFTYRTVAVKLKGEKLILKIPLVKEDGNVEGFLRDKKFWVKVFKYTEEKEVIKSQDNLVRHVISQGVEAGWYININDSWVSQSKNNVVSVLVSQMIGYRRNEIEQMLGKSILDPWELVNHPFKDEYLGDRKWNKGTPQLAFFPQQGKTDTWWELLEHLGAGLDEVVQKNKWCNLNNIVTGGDYLFAWVSLMFQVPENPLPYLFFFGEQNTGKSTLHEALALLFKNSLGYIRADKALVDRSGFNGELLNAVLCVVEEVDLGRNASSANRIKDWVTGKTLSIRAMHKNAFDIINTTHWMQFANFANWCPVFPRDTRIVVIEVGELEEDIPKEQFLGMLKSEAPSFLYEIMNFKKPQQEGRLTLPVLATEHKKDIMSSNSSSIEEFITTKCKIAKGHYIAFSEFYSIFFSWVVTEHPEEQNKWSRKKSSAMFPKISKICKGYIGKEICIGNLSLDMSARDKEFYFLSIGNKLEREEVKK